MKRKAVHITPRCDGRVEVEHALVSTDVHPDKGEPRYGDIADILGCKSVMNVQYAGRILDFSEHWHDSGEYGHDVYVVNPAALSGDNVVRSDVYWGGDIHGDTILGDMLITGRYKNHETSHMVHARLDVDFAALVHPLIKPACTTLKSVSLLV